MNIVEGTHATATPLQHLLAQRLDIERRVLDAVDAADDELRDLQVAADLSDADRDAIFAHLHGDAP